MAEQLAHSGYDWLLVDTQHGPMGYESLVRACWRALPTAAPSRSCASAATADRPGHPAGARHGRGRRAGAVINHDADEARQAGQLLPVSTAGTRSVYFPQRSMNRAGLLGYAGAANDNIIVALQVETADCITNIEEIAAVPGVDILFLGQNDLCMSMGLFGKLTSSR